jgi:hypothetical protein
MSRGSLPPLEDDFSRALLGSAEADAPTSAGYAKVAAALGVGVGLGVGASLPAPAAAVAVGAAGVAGGARWSSTLGVKLFALGASGALIVGAGAFLLHGSHQPDAVNPSGVSSAQHVASRAVQAPPASPRTDSERPALLGISPAPSPAAPSAERASTATAAALRSPAVRLPARRTAHGAPASSASARASTSSSLAEQVQSLDRARVALGSGDSSSALREIARYRAAWPDGVFLTEASVLEIEALAARGERSLARARAADFVEAHPDSPQADRLRALVPAKKR